MKLDLTHRTYDARLAERLEALDFYRGGTAVTSPGREIGYGTFLPVDDDNSADDDTDTTRPRRRARFERVPLNSYLWSSVREDRLSYADRKARCVHVPFFQGIVNIYTGAALKVDPHGHIDTAEAEPWQTFWRDVDLCGTSIGAHMRQSLDLALATGAALTITDKPMFATPAASRAAQLARGERAYAYQVSILDLINWRLDEHGRFVWAVVREPAEDMREPGDEWPDKDKYNYRVWQRHRWDLYGTPEKQGDDWVHLAGGEHPVGEVPIAVLHTRRSHFRRNDLDTDSVLSGLVRVDRAIFNEWSRIAEKLDKQTFAQLFLPDEDSGAPGPISIGPGRYVSFNSSNGTPLLLSPSADTITVHLAAINQLLNWGRQMANVGRGRSEDSKEERSGDALLVESRNEGNRVAALAEAVEEYDHTIHRHIAAWEGLKEYPRVQYRRDVSLRSLERQINDVLSFKTLGVPEGALVEMIRPLLQSHMREQGQGSDVIQRAIAALEGGIADQQATMPPPADEGESVE